jgi:hypothetical protein
MTNKVEVIEIEDALIYLALGLVQKHGYSNIEYDGCYAMYDVQYVEFIGQADTDYQIQVRIKEQSIEVYDRMIDEKHWVLVEKTDLCKLD